MLKTLENSDELIQAFLNNFSCKLSYFLKVFENNMQVVEEENRAYVLVDSGYPSVNLNTVVLKSNIVFQVEKVIDYFKNKDFPFTAYHLDGLDKDQINDILDLGLYSQKDKLIMARELKELPKIDMPDVYKIVEVDSSIRMMDFYNILDKYYDNDKNIVPYYRKLRSYDYSSDGPYKFFIGYRDGIAVSICSLFLGENIAGIYDVVTDKRARRKGLACALATHALHYAKSKGYKVITSYSLKQYSGFFETLGFNEICKLNCYKSVSDDEIIIEEEQEAQNVEISTVAV